jgi:nucleoside-diphosphate-sugar epimerase
MHTIIGANGVIAKNIARALAEKNVPVRLVSRKPQRVNPTDELVTADVLDAGAVSNAVKGSQTVYLTVGLVYDSKVWQRDWPVVMQNVINACKTHKARLVFFDNVYALGLVKGAMTEDSPMRPNSKKGEVRARLCQMILDEVKSGNLTAIIARAPDFYGPETPNSFLNVTVVNRLKAGKGAQAFGNPAKLHSFIFTPDAGRATALLGLTDSAYNQIWNLPVPQPTLTARDLIALAAKVSGGPAGVQVMPKWMVWAVGLFVKILAEMVEMLYQYEEDYVFDCAKFNKAFPDFKATPYEEGLKQTFANP